MISYLLFASIYLLISISYADDSCGIHFYGSSYVGMSGDSANTVFSTEEFVQHTFEVWANPSRLVSPEQNILQTGIIGNIKPGGISWAVEFKLKVTIWQQGHTKPSSSVLYIDVWTSAAAEHGAPVWSKTRYYVILGEENYPWVHATFTTPSDVSATESATLLINGKRRRMDKYSTIVSDATPRPDFAIGDRFHGAIDEIRIWKGVPTADINSPLCSGDINSNTVLYIPFSECGGDVFVGYKQDNTVCAMMYGAYGDIAPLTADTASNSQSNSIWTNDSPVVSRACTLAAEGQCTNATRISTATSADNSENLDDKWSIMPTDPKIIALPLAVLLLAFLVRSTMKSQRQQLPTHVVA